MADCIFCQVSAAALPASVVYRDEHAMVILDLFPVHEGHALVIPHQHCPRVEDLPDALASHLMALGQATIRAQQAAGLGGDAQNLLVNNGPAANQHVPHVHLHVVPRRRGDTLGTIWNWSTRMLVPGAEARRRKRLDAVASRLGACFQAPQSNA
ncbi:MAG: HIT domain-containing protein [Alcanivoracaceae bacterium]|nr:HIT domain-containing protein [Alcanivoracaceae bacterium]